MTAIDTVAADLARPAVDLSGFASTSVGGHVFRERVVRQSRNSHHRRDSTILPDSYHQMKWVLTIRRLKNRLKVDVS
jgi:hypothetical protein